MAPRRRTYSTFVPRWELASRLTGACAGERSPAVQRGRPGRGRLGLALVRIVEHTRDNRTLSTPFAGQTAR
eukprot:scaffold38882_cov320-Isochrysis_galbana.AAC.3